MGGRRFHGRTYGPDILTEPGRRPPVIDPDLGKFGQYGYRSWTFPVCDDPAAIHDPGTIPCETCDAPPGARCWNLNDHSRSPFRRYAASPHRRRVFWVNVTRWRYVRWPAFVPAPCPSVYEGWQCDLTVDHVWRRERHRAGDGGAHVGATWSVRACQRVTTSGAGGPS